MQAALLDHEPNYKAAEFPEPRPFQNTAHEQLRQGAREGHRCQLLMSPTGSGKTYLGMRAIHEALLKGKRAMFVCDRNTLINQTSEVADQYGLTAHSIIQAGHWRYDLRENFQIASVQTLARRSWPDTDLIVIDEAHSMYSAWTDHIQNCRAHVIALSATPFSKGLGKLFSNLINAATMHDLTQSGVLVPMRVFSCTKINMEGAATAGGEWTDTASEQRGMEIIGDVVIEWQKFAEGRKTIVFGATIKHCEEICRQFNESGIMAATFTSDTSDSERKALLKEYSKSDSQLKVLISVEALAKGFDVRDVGCVCDCRPLRKSLSTAIQMWGRGLRSSPDTGKVDCIARDTLILTDSGLVKIQDITTGHKVWDGCNFVEHSGAVCKGIQAVITYQGLTATPDHEVMTNDGWIRFEEAARNKRQITRSGIGWEPIRVTQNSVEENNGKRRVSARRSAMWKMLTYPYGLIYEYAQKTEYKSLSSLQRKKSGACPEMVVSKMSGLATEMHKPVDLFLRKVRGAWNRVSILFSKCSNALGFGKSWYTQECGVYGIGQDRQQQTLRARESEVGFSIRKHEQFKESGWAKQKEIYSIQNKSSKGSLCGCNPISINPDRPDGFRDCGSMESTIIQAEREVWDIVNAGPLQRFTAGGFLVHNCILLDFSGNIIRFADDFSDIYYNGLDQLDAGEKLDKAIRRDPEDKEPSKCPSCGFTPFGKRCISCGHENQTKSLIEHLPGEMSEVKIGKQKLADDHKHLWEQLCTYTRSHGKPETAAARAWHLFQDFAKCKPGRGWKFEDQPNVPICQATLNHIKRKNIAYINGIKKGKSK